MLPIKLWQLIENADSLEIADLITACVKNSACKMISREEIYIKKIVEKRRNVFFHLFHFMWEKNGLQTAVLQ